MNMHKSMNYSRDLPTEIKSKIPDRLLNLILKSLEKNPNDRPKTILEFRNELANIPCTNIWTKEEAKKWWISYQNDQSI